MAGARKDSRLQSRAARTALKSRNQPYWANIGKGLYLGYRKGPKAGSWYWRTYTGKRRYHQALIARADDHLDADGVHTLTYYQAAEAARKASGDFERAGAPGASLTVEQAAKRYLTWFREHRKAVRETELTIEKHILPRFGETLVSALKTRDIRDWHSKLAAAPARKRTKIGARQQFRAKAKTADEKRARRATANRILTVFKAVLNRAFHDDLVADDAAWRRVKPFEKVDQPVIRFLTESECKRLVNACTKDFRPLVKAALFTGARCGELTGLRTGDVNMKTGQVFIRPSKSGRGRHVPLNPDGLDFFRKAIVDKASADLVFTKADGKPWGENHHMRPLLAACAGAKIVPPVSFHELRHTYASTLAQLGVDLLTISKLLGHADTRITSRHYAHLADENLRSAVAKLPGFGHEPEDDNVSAIG